MHAIVKSFFALVFCLSVAACKTHSTSVLVGDKYDDKSNQTVLTLLPYGNIVMPGKWVKKSYNEVSRQHFFTNNDSTAIALAINPKEKYPFFKPSQSDQDFVVDFVNWETDFWQQQSLEAKWLEDSSANGYIVWQVEGKNTNNIFLFAAKNGLAYNFLAASPKWDDAQKVLFLRDLFLKNQH